HGRAFSFPQKTISGFFLPRCRNFESLRVVTVMTENENLRFPPGRNCCLLDNQQGWRTPLATHAAHVQENSQAPNPRFRPQPLIAALLLVMMAWLAWGAALKESVTFDELAHVGAGLSYWQTFDLRLNEEHPPLAKLL